MSYQPEQHWQERLSQDFSLAATGHSGFSRYYNRWMYRLRAVRLAQALRACRVAVKAAAVLDIGCGTGYFVRYYLCRGAARVKGVDITDVSVQALRRRFPQQTFEKLDIAACRADLGGTFDIINVFDVLYHIVDDAGFHRAVRALAAACKPGAWVVITDAFDPAAGRCEHVRYRDLQTYRALLGEAGLVIRQVRPLFYRMSARAVRGDGNSFFSRIKSKLIDMAAPIDYICDRLYCPLGRATMLLVLCQKI